MEALLPPIFTIAVGLGSFPSKALVSAEFSSSKARSLSPAPRIILWYLTVSSLGTAARNTSTVVGLVASTGPVGISMMDQSRTTSLSGAGMYLCASNGSALARSFSDK